MGFYLKLSMKRTQTNSFDLLFFRCCLEIEREFLVFEDTASDVIPICLQFSDASLFFFALKTRLNRTVVMFADRFFQYFQF